MKELSTALAAHIGASVTTLAMCWKITRRDGTVLGFTDHDVDVRYENVTYLAASGFTPSAVASSSMLNVDDLDVEGMLSANAISENDIMNGAYDYAQIEVFQLNYNDPTQGTLSLRTGWLGEVQTQGDQFVAEVRGLAQQLSQTLGDRYSAGCRANLGDARCRVDLAGFMHNGTITDVTSKSVISDSTRTQADGYFTNGTLKFTSGANAGRTLEIKNYTDGEFVAVLPFPADIAVGDTYIAVAGCDKRLVTCRDVFANAENFRGEPHVPGIDRMLQTAGTRSDWG